MPHKASREGLLIDADLKMSQEQASNKILDSTLTEVKIS